MESIKKAISEYIDSENTPKYAQDEIEASDINALKSYLSMTEEEQYIDMAHVFPYYITDWISDNGYEDEIPALEEDYEIVDWLEEDDYDENYDMDIDIFYNIFDAIKWCIKYPNRLKEAGSIHNRR